MFHLWRRIYQDAWQMELIKSKTALVEASDSSSEESMFTLLSFPHCTQARTESLKKGAFKMEKEEVIVTKVASMQAGY